MLVSADAEKTNPIKPNPPADAEANFGQNYDEEQF